MRRLLLWVCLLPALFSVIPTPVQAVDFWVWHRNKPLTEGETATLKSLGTSTLYWHVGVMENKTGTWKWKTPPRPAPPGGNDAKFRIVPVVRLETEARQPFAPKALQSLGGDLQQIAGPAGLLQLDYDCPDRLLPEYAAALRQIRQKAPHLSITALANWPRLLGFRELTASVEEIAPMFYDLQADPTGVSVESPPPPLLDPAQLEAVIRPWQTCSIPWRAGLPTFSRVTVFDRTGLSRGQIPNWTWDDICFHKSLHTLAPTRLGVTMLRSDGEARVASTPVAADELIVSRSIDRAALQRSIAVAQSAGASGIILFRLPDGSGPGGASLSDLAELSTSSKPNLLLRRGETDRLELTNDSTVDLPPRLSGEKSDRDRGYALEIDASAPIFREALAGDFWKVTSHAQPDAKKPVAVVVPLATRLTFWFSHLRAGAVLQTGLVQLAPETDLASLRYRVIDGGTPGPWKPISPAPAFTATP